MQYFYLQRGGFWWRSTHRRPFLRAAKKINPSAPSGGVFSVPSCKMNCAADEGEKLAAARAPICARAHLCSHTHTKLLLAREYNEKIPRLVSQMRFYLFCRRAVTHKRLYIHKRHAPRAQNPPLNSPAYNLQKAKIIVLLRCTHSAIYYYLSLK